MKFRPMYRVGRAVYFGFLPSFRQNRETTRPACRVKSCVLEWRGGSLKHARKHMILAVGSTGLRNVLIGIHTWMSLYVGATTPAMLVIVLSPVGWF